MAKQKFGDWLQDRLNERGWLAADLSRAINRDSAVVSNILNNKRAQPAVESLKLIAKALQVPLEEVYRAADILPEKPDADTFTETVISLMGDLDTKEKQDILEYVRLRHRLSAEQHNRTDNPRNRKRVVGHAS